MPKLKTNRALYKRLRLTKSGKLKKRSAGRQHILGKKSRKRKRKLRMNSYLAGGDAKKLRRLLPYGTT